jgi:uncharacterized protein (DUF488 family)
MYYRRKIILSLLDAFGGKLSNLKFQKLLFLFTKEQVNAVYDFVPYKYGPFSFQSYQDKRTMTKYKQLSDTESWEKKDEKKYLNEIGETDRNIINALKQKYYEIAESKLISFVYSNYPEYAINSEIKIKYNLKSVKVPLNNNFEFFTIGYEGHTIDSYLNLLLSNNIKALCDVRKNPVSMKYGFSKNQLKNILNKFQIEYIHIPELGIDSNKRQELNTPEDYQNLFIKYSKNILPDNLIHIEQLINIFLDYKRIAITCFESDHNFCHRHMITEHIQKRKNWDYKILHI